MARILPLTLLSFLGNETVGPSCSGVWTYDERDRCDFVQTAVDCQSESSLIDFGQLLFCPSILNILYIPSWLWMTVIILILFTLVGFIADLFLVPALRVVKVHYALRDVVCGGIILALGNSLPDMFAGLTAIAQDRQQMVLGEILGGNLFNCCVIFSLILLAYHVSGGEVHFIFLVGLVAYLFGAFHWFCMHSISGEISIINLVINLLVFVAFYVLLYFYPTEDEDMLYVQISGHNRSKDDEDSGTTNDDDIPRGFLCKIYDFCKLVDDLFCAGTGLLLTFFIPLPPAVSGEASNIHYKAPRIFAYFFLPSVIAVSISNITGLYYGLQLYYWTLIAGVLLATFIVCLTFAADRHSLDILDSFCAFVVSVFILHRLCTELVDGIRIAGVLLHVPDEFLASTFLTFGNFLGDSMTYICLLRAGQHSLALMGCISCMLVGLLLSPSLVFLLSMSYFDATEIFLQTSFLTQIFSFAMVTAPVITLTILAINKGRPHSSISWLLLGLYSCTVVTIVVHQLTPSS